MAIEPESERRQAPRYSFLAPVEVLDCQSETIWKGQTSDLSLLGCYVDTLNPLPVGAEVKLKIEHQDEILETAGRVVNAQPYMGMGIMFAEIEPAQQRRLQDWLEQVRAQSE